jgi:hypothetical protein
MVKDPLKCHMAMLQVSRLTGPPIKWAGGIVDENHYGPPALNGAAEEFRNLEKFTSEWGLAITENKIKEMMEEKR